MRGALTACSACAGKYEDPDATAWPTPEEEQLEGFEAEDEDSVDANK